VNHRGMRTTLKVPECCTSPISVGAHV